MAYRLEGIITGRQDACIIAIILYLSRDTVMKILKQEDPAGNELRKKRSLKRRLYRSKVTVHVYRSMA